jgi:hypothetical membrane protein
MLLDLLKSPQGFKLFGLIGAMIAVIGSLITALLYRGIEGQLYSPLNYYVSELGEVGVSKLAWVFNLSLILAGVFLIPACISLGLILPGVLAKIGMVVGVVCSLCLSLVGVFPMNKEEAHGFFAIWFFRTGLAMVFFFSLAIAFQPSPDLVLSRWLAFVGLPAMLSFSAFLIMAPRIDEEENPIANEDIDRPKLWPLVAVEWLIFVTIVLWFVVIAWGF